MRNFSTSRSGSPSTRRGILFVVLMVLALGISLAQALAQYQVGRGGQALDRNLLQGSGGYNTRVSSSSAAFSRPAYQPGMSKPLYTYNSRGRLEYNEYNAFNPQSSYTLPGYYMRDYSAASFARFRYPN